MKNAQVLAKLASVFKIIALVVILIFLPRFFFPITNAKKYAQTIPMRTNLQINARHVFLPVRSVQVPQHVPHVSQENIY